MIYLIVQAKDLKDVPDPSPHCLPFYPLVSKRLANLVNSSFQYPSDLCISLHLPCHYYSPGILHWPHKWYSTLSLHSNSLPVLQSLPKAHLSMSVFTLLSIFKYGLQKALVSTSPNLSSKPLSTLYSIGWTS